MPTVRTLHLLPNAHLDPVWLWDWREGLNEGLVTIRTVLDLMDEFPELTFLRGEVSIYEHVERTDPATFARLRRQVEAGRWDVVGGTYVQPDSNLPAAETLCRQFERGLAYFESRFGRRPTVAWQADSFGHTPGWPDILRAFGMEDFAFTRPGRGQFPMAAPAFRWLTGSGDDGVLCYRPHWPAYCNERANLPEVLDATWRDAAAHPFENVGVLFGLGNHGGGPTRRHVEEVRAWAAAHPEAGVRFSTLHGFFAALRAELARSPAADAAVEAVRGDLGYCLRGCYSSVAKFKFPYRRTEALLSAAETAQAVVAAALGVAPLPLDEAWDAVLFNSFHDVLPGSSIERAFDDQLAWIGGAAHRALVARTGALNALASQADTRVPPPEAPDRPRDVSLLVCNGLPRPFKGWFELEANMDYRPVAGAPFTVGSLPLFFEGADGSRPLFQEVMVEHRANQGAAWRKRVAVCDEL
ncbi:MAG: alpha-mannosidase, partial [Gluconacetobacter diazotrophicus]|nr:alpha-mannosidase [Gluconacetobacter diazotrophicus]